MKYLLLLVLYSTFNFNCARFLPPSVEAFGTVPETYWRDYNGLVPADAVPGGKNADGDITYIGQMYIAGGTSNENSKVHIIPVTIANGNRTAIGAYRGKALASNDDSHIKVFCIQYVGNLKWNPQETLVTVGCRYVVVGYEDSIPLLLGRAEHNKETIIGKIFSEGGRHYTGLIIPYQNGEFLPPTYEILMTC